ncbi:Proton-coupled folate transporter like protein [Argiope bruennichi]|uniref:Proton-coupled folate transporter like protein n=1 Tax=Argiope bruennichi TaxID=94029 RepID=A0A8T0EJ72_ARGBR|nr:Proton-coupled folate transporter like protein [Argiope bruennichi]
MSGKPFHIRISEILKKTTVEPFLFLVMFGYNCRMVTLQSLLHDRACRISLNFSDEVCADLDNEDNDLEQTQAVKYGNNIYNAVIILSTLPALVMALFLGPWSDRYSRKYPILMATMAITIDTSIQAVITSFKDASPYWFMVSCPISGFTGGLIIVLSSTYSYMSDITDERSRQVRYAVLEFFTIMATPIGALVSGQLFKLGASLTVGKYLPAMILSPCSFAMAWLWMRFYVVETKPRRFDITRKQIFQDLFKLDNLKSSFKTCARKRAGNLRMQIWFLLFVSFSTRLTQLGSLQIGFPYTRKIFKWDVSRYSYTTAIFSLVNAFTTLTVVPFLNRKLMVHEAAVGMVGIMSLMARMVLMSVTVYEFLLFYAWLSGTLYACSGIAVRSRISKLVSKKELGRVFSLLGTCESVTPILGAVSFLQVYNLSVDFFPGLPFALAAIFLIPSACIFAWMMQCPNSL